MNMNRGHGHSNYPGTGPLITEHLQVRNLDRELEMLRYKREVIQREQQLLTMEYEIDRKRQYEHTNRNVANIFGNAWQSPPSKRANIPQQPNPWMSATHDSVEPKMSKSMPINYIPSLLSKKVDPPIIPIGVKPIVHPILQNTVAQRLVRPINARKDFHLTQVSKKKPKPPNKLNSYSVKERKDLVSKATGLQLAKAKVSNLPVDPEMMILREDQIPNKQVTGRLELALGSIVKEIRCSYCHNDIFKKLISNTKHQRIMKQAVRERIRTVMLNKTVGSVADIVNKYREKFPKRSDRDIVELVINSEHPNAVTVIESENPEEFFKKNITSVLKNKIQEMSSNLLKMYTNVRRKATLAYTKAARDANSKVDVPVERESILNNEMAMKVLRGITNKYVTIEERNILTKYYTELIEDILEEKLPEYLPQCTEHFLKIFDLDHQFKAVKFMSIKRIKDEVKANKAAARALQVENEVNTEASHEEETLPKEIPDNDEMATEIVTENEEIDQTRNIKHIKFEEEITIENEEIGQTTNIINDKIEKEKVTKNEEMEENTTNGNNNMKKEEITENNDTMKIVSEKMSEKNISTEIDNTKVFTPLMTVPASLPEQTLEDNKPTTPVAKMTESSSMTIISPLPMSTPLAKDLPYNVKLIGRPKLPNRAAICDFLSNYRPNSIKKHKSINNLLVIGFMNEEDYNKILTANETSIGDVTLIIKASEKVNSGKENESVKLTNDMKKENVTETHANNYFEKVTKEESKSENKVKDENGTCKETTNDSNTEKIDDEKVLVEKEIEVQIGDHLSTINQTDENNGGSNEVPSLEPIKEDEVELNNGGTLVSNKPDKNSKVNVKESGRATPVRSSSRLGNITPSTIRTRRASRLMQE